MGIFIHSANIYWVFWALWIEQGTKNIKDCLPEAYINIMEDKERQLPNIHIQWWGVLWWKYNIRKGVESAVCFTLRTQAVNTAILRSNDMKKLSQVQVQESIRMFVVNSHGAIIRGKQIHDTVCLNHDISLCVTAILICVSTTWQHDRQCSLHPLCGWGILNNWLSRVTNSRTGRQTTVSASLSHPLLSGASPRSRENTKYLFTKTLAFLSLRQPTTGMTLIPFADISHG